MNSQSSFKIGCKGYLISVLQRALGIPDDGIYGRQTFVSVKDVQRRWMMPETGDADVKVFRALNIRWPDDFDRCLQVTAAFEGTGFGGVNSTDIDGAGVTLGLAGFTTKHHEVQSLLAEYIHENPSALDVVPGAMRDELRSLCTRHYTSKPPKQAEWDRWFYSDTGRTKQAAKNVLAAWGKDPVFQGLQLEKIIKNFWAPAVKSGIKLGLRSLHGFGLMLDIQVQNGGWRATHQQKYAMESQDGSEAARLRAIARVVASSAIPKWQNDVLARKMVFAMGAGKVHGSFYDLSAWGFQPLEVVPMK